MDKNYFLLFFLLLNISLFSQNPPTTTLWAYQSEGFEGATFPPTNWEVVHFSPATTDFEHSTTVGGFQASSSCTFFNSIAATGNVHVLRTPSFDLTTAIQPTVTFDIAYASDYDASNNTDRFRMYRTLNTNGTSGWQTVPNSTFINETLTTAPNQTTYFTPDQASDWQTFTVDLSLYAGQSYVRFAFEVNPGANRNVLYLDNVNFYDASPLAINKENFINFSIYPNPSEGLVRVNTVLKNLEVHNFNVRNILGQDINNFGFSKINPTSYQLDLNNIKSGMYFITVSEGEKSTTKKFYIK